MDPRSVWVIPRDKATAARGNQDLIKARLTANRNNPAISILCLDSCSQVKMKVQIVNKHMNSCITEIAIASQSQVLN